MFASMKTSEPSGTSSGTILGFLEVELRIFGDRPAEGRIDAHLQRPPRRRYLNDGRRRFTVLDAQRDFLVLRQRDLLARYEHLAVKSGFDHEHRSMLPPGATRNNSARLGAVAARRKARRDAGWVRLLPGESRDLRRRDSRKE